jgi:hypothetical protein
MPKEKRTKSTVELTGNKKDTSTENQGTSKFWEFKCNPRVEFERDKH